MTDNPWHIIKNEDYEKHMGHENVNQLQMLSNITGEQIDLVKDMNKPAIAILGITNGNGLEYIEKSRYKAVIGMDISSEFLSICHKRYGYLEPVLKLHEIDLITQKQSAVEILQDADLIIANLLVEHIHLDNFMDIIKTLHKAIISITIQVNPDGVLVSHSGYEGVFTDVVELVRECDENSIVCAMKYSAYKLINRYEYGLPNGKLLLRLDFYRV